jgi:hypothetical protein
VRGPELKTQYTKNNFLLKKKNLRRSSLVESAILVMRVLGGSRPMTARMSEKEGPEYYAKNH